MASRELRGAGLGMGLSFRILLVVSNGRVLALAS